MYQQIEGVYVMEGIDPNRKPTPGPSDKKKKKKKRKSNKPKHVPVTEPVVEEEEKHEKSGKKKREKGELLPDAVVGHQPVAYSIDMYRKMCNKGMTFTSRELGDLTPKDMQLANLYADQPTVDREGMLAWLQAQEGYENTTFAEYAGGGQALGRKFNRGPNNETSYHGPVYYCPDVKRVNAFSTKPLKELKLAHPWYKCTPLSPSYKGECMVAVLAMDRCETDITHCFQLSCSKGIWWQHSVREQKDAKGFPVQGVVDFPDAGLLCLQTSAELEKGLHPTGEEQLMKVWHISTPSMSETHKREPRKKKPRKKKTNI
jgi:hypothetical protein